MHAIFRARVVLKRCGLIVTDMHFDDHCEGKYQKRVKSYCQSSVKCPVHGWSRFIGSRSVSSVCSSARSVCLFVG